MRKQKNKRIIIDELVVTKMAAEGKAMGHHEGKVIFVDFGVPGDVVKVQTTFSKKDYAVASIVDIITPSPIRTEAACEHFGTCGGCRWQHIPYSDQTGYKQQLVQEAFERIGHLDFPEIQKIIGAPDVFEYRNKMEYTFSNRGWLTQEQIDSGEEFERRVLGFHVPGRFDGVMQINKCYLQDDLGNQIRNFVHQYSVEKDFTFYNVKMHEGFLRNLIMRNNLAGEWMVTVSFGENNIEDIHGLLDELIKNFPAIISLNYVHNYKKNDTLYDLDITNYYGETYLTETLDGIKYKIGPKSFFQTNSKQAKNLYDVVRKMATIRPEHTVYDLYTGTGSIALYVAKTAKKVIGIETVAEAIEDAQFNQELNNINNATFIASPVEKILDEDFINKHGKPDVVITDPPRMGMHEKVIEVLLAAEPQQIVYVSCNPSTQARDLSLLSVKYDILEVQPVDMFPNTFHIENVVNLQLKSNS